MPTLDKIIDDAVRFADAAFRVFNINIDTIASLACFISALGCVYLISVILKERTPLVYLQRWALAGLAVALLANGITYYNEWETVQGHRPAGAVVDVMVMLVVIIMAIRGNLIYQPRRHHPGDEEHTHG